MRKLLSWFLVCGVCVCLSAGAASGAEKISIGVAMDNLDDPFWMGVKKGIDAAVKELGDKIEVSIQVCLGDANVQHKQIEDMVTAGADAIACIYVDSETIRQSVELCNEKNIPFVYLDRTLESDDEITVSWGFATDNYALTVAGWEYMADYARKNGIKWKVLELVGSLTDQNVLFRTEGFEKVMADNPDIIERIQSVPTEWNLEKALAGCTNALQASPDINCIFMHSDYLLAPTIQALEAASRWVEIGKPGHVAVMPYSGAALSIQAMKDKKVEMCFGMDTFGAGYEGVIAAYKFAAGIDDPKYKAFVNDPGFVITQENFAQTAPRAYGWE
jgi:ABC-type sugar transport system substrate-binding protein